MTLQEKLRLHRVILKSGDYNGAQLMEAWCAMINAADALDAKDARIKGLQGALQDILAAHANDNIRPKAFYIASAALDRAQEALK